MKWKRCFTNKEMHMIMPDKYRQLVQWMEGMNGVAVAFSGGVDSTFVLAVAKKVLGDRVLALTVKTPYIPDWELAEAIAFCSENGIQHQIVHAGILPEILHNPENRCYLCKRHVFTILKDKALQAGFEHLLDGSNADDTGVYRPGLAALCELGIRSPLLENGITKPEVRRFSADMGLPTAEKPSYACLLTRLPYNSEVKPDELKRIEQAELYLSSIGYRASRVRSHGDIARIELEKESIAAFVNSGEVAKLIATFHEIGYRFVTIDLEGYRSGSFDKGINQITT